MNIMDQIETASQQLKQSASLPSCAVAVGVIHGWLDEDLSAGLRYGVTLAALALSQFGDMVVTNKSELLALSRGSSSLVS